MTTPTLRGAALLGTALLVSLAGPAAAQQQSPAQACGDLVADFRSAVLHEEREIGATNLPEATLPQRTPDVGGITTPSAIGEGVGLDEGEAPSMALDTMTDASRSEALPVGVILSDEERQRVRDLVQQASRAAEQGNAQDCLRHLESARTVARRADVQASQGGVGSPLQGEALPDADATAGGPSAVDVPDAVDEDVREGIPNLPGGDLPLDEATEAPMEEALEPPPINPTGSAIGDPAPGSLDPNLPTPALDGGGLGGSAGGEPIGGGGLGGGRPGGGAVGDGLGGGGLGGGLSR